MTKPNLFESATSELSQDGFLTWLIKWADIENRQYNERLHEVAHSFVMLLLKNIVPCHFEIRTVTSDRQLKNIDVWAEVNSKYFIVIEDKTFTGEHSGQLERYKDEIQEHYKNQDFIYQFIYLKSGNESATKLREIKDKGYVPISRKNILDVLNEKEVQNDIFNDFKNYVIGIEEITNSYTDFENVTSKWRAAEGFYMNLQVLLELDSSRDWIGWGYVSNPNRGFLGFWYHSKAFEDFELYIQIENYVNEFEPNFRVVIKICELKTGSPLKVDVFYQILSELKIIALKYDLQIEKPDRYKVGKTSTLAVVQIIEPNKKDFDMNYFVGILKKIEKTLDDYSK